ncbi:hypothetical protein ABPG75_011707 [Micractinium tetrahymenae]
MRLLSSLGASRGPQLAPSCGARPRPRRPPPLTLLPGHGWPPAAPAPDLPPLCCAAAPKWVVEKAVEALKEEHGKPTDREMAAAATAALAATASTLHHSKTAVGYLAREAPLRTWLPLLLCAVAAAAGTAMARRQLVWAAAGGLAAFAVTMWQQFTANCRSFPSSSQVLAPLVRRFQELRRHLLENDRAAKQRLDAAAGQLHKVICERGEALQDADQARREVGQLRQQLDEAAATAGVASNEPAEEEEAGGDSSGAVEQLAAQRAELETALEERRQQDQRLAGILNNALNAAAVPTPAGSDGECPTDASTEYEGDGYNERSLDRSNTLELAAALQSRVDMLRQQAQEAAQQEEEVEHLRSELRERSDSVAALQAQLELARVDARRLPQLQQYARDLEWQLLQEQQGRQAQLEAAEAQGRQAGAAAASALATDATGTGAAPAAEGSQGGHDKETLSKQSGEAAEGAGAAANSAVPAPPRRSRGRPRGSGKRQLAEGARVALNVADELALLREQLASAERHLAAYDKLVHTLEGKLEELHDHEQGEGGAAAAEPAH